MQSLIKSRMAGLEAWQITLAVVFFAQMTTAIGFSLVFPFLPLYIDFLGSHTDISTEFWAGMVISAQALMMALAAPFWGVLADRYGRKPMVLRAMVGGALILSLMGFARSAEELVLMRAVQGLITGTVAANNALVASKVPREQVGFSMGVLMVGQWGGVALGPLLGGVLTDAFGYRLPFILTGLLLLIGGLLIWWLIDEDFTPRETDKGQGFDFIQHWRHILTAEGVRMVFLLRFMAGIGRVLIIPIAPLFVVSLLAETTSQNTYAGLVIAVSSAAATFSGVYLGRLGDRIGHRQVLIGAGLFGALFYFPQVLVVDVWQLLVLTALTGLANGGLLASPSALIARYTQRGEEGAAYGLDNSIVAGSRAVAPLLGASIAVAFGLRGTFAAAGILLVLVALLALAFLPDDRLKRGSA